MLETPAGSPGRGLVFQAGLKLLTAAPNTVIRTASQPAA
jgi:hypothetical protein